jgi:hypothetical protein
MNKISLIAIGLVLISLTGGGAMAEKLTDEQKIINDYTNTKAAIQLEIDILEDLKTSVSTWNDLS